MVKPTPWGRGGGPGSEQLGAAEGAATAASASLPGDPDPRTSAAARRRAQAVMLLRQARHRAEGIRTAPRLTGKWGYVLAAVTGIVNFMLLFQHWLVARGPDGSASATAFGRIDSSTRYLSVWSGQGSPPAANLTGIWAITASAAIAVTLAAVAIYIATDAPRFARIATGSAVLTALLVIATVLYLAARQKELKAMTGRRWDLGGQIGSWINWAFNDGAKPVAGMDQVDYVATGTITTPAIAAVILAVAAAVTAVAVMPRGVSARAPRLPWQISVSRATTADYTATGATSAGDGEAATPAEPGPQRSAADETAAEPAASPAESNDPAPGGSADAGRQ